MPGPEHNRDPEVQRQVLQAASDCFDRMGFRRTTMDDVAAAAKVSRMTVYNYFRNKTELINSFLEIEARRVFDEARARLDMTLPPDELLAAAEIAVLQVGTASDHAQVILDPDSLSLSLDGSYSDPKRHIIDGYWNEILEHLDAQGVLRTDVERPLLLRWLMSNHLMCAALPETRNGDTTLSGEMLRTFLGNSILDPDALIELRAGGASRSRGGTQA